MKHVTWPAVAVFIAVLAALATIFGLSDDPAMRQQILHYFDSVVPFILGIGAGAVAGGAAGYAGGFMKGNTTAKAETQRLAELQLATDTAQPRPDSVRRAAEVVRVAADESHQAADEARAAAIALRTAAEEARAVADLQRSLLAETRRTTAGTSDGPHVPPARLGLQGR
jgi:alkanesulfonate monooxygenase SsuD/methylene tetrahydromethanopterin reductase-like flavin-dependent oxidoreductase (luciferase family)